MRKTFAAIMCALALSVGVAAEKHHGDATFKVLYCLDSDGEHLRQTPCTRERMFDALRKMEKPPPELSAFHITFATFAQLTKEK